MLKKLALLFLVLFTLGLTACSSDDTSAPTIEYPKTYNIVDVTAATVTDDGVVITLETDGFRGLIEVEVTVEDGKIVKYEVTEHEESDGYGKDIIDEGSLAQAFIDETDDLDTFDLDSHVVVDTTSGATAGITGEALLEMALTALEHYEDDYK